MLTSYSLYGDAGGGHDHGFVVVSGYLSTLQRWENFNQEWKRILATFDVPYFHMKEFAHFKGPFATWKGDEEKRKRFLGHLVEVIRFNVDSGVSALVRFADFESVNRHYELSERFGHPYALCASSCVSTAQRYDSELTYVFEDGDEGKGHLMRVMEESGMNAPVFRYSRDKIDENGKKVRGYVQLQAADFAAYELRSVFNADPDETWPIEEYRGSLRALSSIKSDWARFTENDLVKTCQRSKIPRRG